MKDGYITSSTCAIMYGIFIGISLKRNYDKSDSEMFGFCKKLKIKESNWIIRDVVRIVIIIVILGVTAGIIYFVIPYKKKNNVHYYINYTLMEVLVFIEFYYIVPKVLKKFGVARIEDFSDL